MSNKNLKLILPDLDLHSILMSTPGYVYWKNRDSVYIGCNQNVATLLGLSSPEDIIGKTDFDFPWGHILEIPQKAVRDDQHVLDTKTIFITEDPLGVQNHNGLEIILRTEKKPLFDKHSQIVGILGVAVDITDAKETARLLKLENEKYERLTKEHEEVKDFLDSMFRYQQSEMVKFLRKGIGGIQSVGFLDIELTPRESQILYLLYHKYNPKTIADYISKKTNKIISHDSINALINKRLYIKFKVNSVDKLIEKAILLKLIPLLYPEDKKKD